MPILLACILLLRFVEHCQARQQVMGFCIILVFRSAELTIDLDIAKQFNRKNTDLQVGEWVGGVR